MIDKRTISKTKKLELAIPDMGFSNDFIISIRKICSKYDRLKSSYLVLKKEEGEDVCFLFGFEFDEEQLESYLKIENIMTEILELFEEDLVFEGICLNENVKLKDAIMKITEPFFLR